MQKFTRLYDYIHEYQRMVYDTYSKIGVAFLVTYYNLNEGETVWENEDLMGGAYERVGNLATGIKRNKILLLPIYFPDEVSSPFDGQDIGYNKENITVIVFPSSYGVTPYPGDVIKLEQEYLRPTNDTYPTFLVEGVDISANTDRRFWKLTLRTFESVGLSEVEEQVENTYVFVDYDKTVHTLVDSQLIANLLYKNELARENLHNMFDQNSGFYLN